MKRIILFFGLLALSLSNVNTGAALPGNSTFDSAGQGIDGNLDSALNWLTSTHQNEDGGFTSFSAGAGQEPSDIAGTIDALLAIGPAGGESAPLLDYLEANKDRLSEFASQDGSTAGKTILALSRSGEDPQNFAGIDFVSLLDQQFMPNGRFNVENAFNQSLAILGYANAGKSILPESTEWLIGLQTSDGEMAGSWDDGFGTMGNADATAMAIMALGASGQESAADAIGAGLDFLNRTQLASGGWEYGPGFGENANSTALVIQALEATGEDFVSEDSRWVKNGLNPMDALLSWQSETGAFQADFGDGRFDDFFSTVQTIPALLSQQEPGVNASESTSAALGGDSLVPYVVVGVVLILLVIMIGWLVNKNR